MHRISFAALTGIALLHAQALKFDVASLKPTPLGVAASGIRVEPGGQTYRGTNVTLKYMMTVAYRIKPDQIVGAPPWMISDRYDMIANAEKPSRVEELHAMLKNLLTERCQLKFHFETKELPTYALSVDNSGAKLTPHETQNAGDSLIEVWSSEPLHIKLKASSAPMDYLAFRLAERLDRPVIDQTNLKGAYDFDLAYTMEPPPSMHEGMVGHNGVPIDFSGPNIFEALRQQLGLRLEPKKGPVQIIVIDHIEKPAAN